MDPSRKTVRIVDRSQVRALAEVVHGQGMLEELAPWPGGEVLWNTFLFVKGRAVAPRNRLEGRDLEELTEQGIHESQGGAAWNTSGLRESLEVVRSMLLHPAFGDPLDASLSCRQISSWAEERNLAVTRFCFAALAGLHSLDDSREVYRVGVLARDLAHWDTARAWLKHAALVARRMKSWDEQIVAIQGIGNTFYRQGIFRKAKSTLLRALKLARKHSLIEREGLVLHDLFGAVADLRDTRAAERYARLALSAYGPRHANVPALAHDLAYLWLCEGYPARALSVFKAVLPRFESQPGARMRVLASIARAAAAVGSMALFDEARAQVRDISRDPGVASAVCSSLLELVYGSIAAGKWELAEQDAQSALQVATSRGEVDIVVKADSLLKMIALRIRASTCWTQFPGVCSPAGITVVDAASEKLAERLIRSIIASDLSRSVDAARYPSFGAGPRVPRTEPSKPSPFAQGPHSVTRRCPWSGSVIDYATYVRSTDASAVTGWVLALSFEMEGLTSFNRATATDVPPPHVHDPSVPGGVRAARPDEIPRRPW